MQRCVKGNGVMFPMDLQMVTMLLEHGANPFCADHKGDLLSFALTHNFSNSCINSHCNNNDDNCRIEFTTYSRNNSLDDSNVEFDRQK